LVPGTETANGSERTIKGDITTVTNMPLASFFRQVDVSLNEVNVSADTGSHYAYKAYIDTLLCSDHHTTATILQSELFFRDTYDNMDGSFLSNDGFTNRYGYTRDSSIVTVKGPIRSDIFQQNRLILPGVRISIKMYPSEDSFRITNMLGIKKEFKVEIMDACMEMCHIIPTQEVQAAHKEALKVRPCILPLTRSCLKSYNIQMGAQSYTVEDMFFNNIPNELIICLIESGRFNGDFRLNPFMLDHFNLSFLEYKVDGVSIPGSALTPDFVSGDYVDCYNALFSNNSRAYIAREEFASGFTIFRFTVNERMAEDIAIRNNQGHSRLNLKFKTPLPSNTTLLVYGKTSSSIEIDAEKNVFVNN